MARPIDRVRRGRGPSCGQHFADDLQEPDGWERHLAGPGSVASGAELQLGTLAVWLTSMLLIGTPAGELAGLRGALPDPSSRSCSR